MVGQLHGKVALVTGAGSGIGRAAAQRFAQAGASVVVADVDADGGAATGRLIEAAGGRAIFVWADVSRADEVEALVRAAVDAYGRLDCAYNNAGVVGALVPTADYPEAEWDRVLGVNLKGVWLCMKYELTQMLAQGGGAIVNASSAAGLSSGPAAAYCASKYGVVGLTKTAAGEYAGQGIRVNAVCPGPIRTPMTAQVEATDPEREARVRAAVPAGRLGTPEEVAEAVVWLCSDAAAFVTGHALVVDGGLLL